MPWLKPSPALLSEPEVIDIDNVLIHNVSYHGIDNNDDMALDYE